MKKRKKRVYGHANSQKSRFHPVLRHSEHSSIENEVMPKSGVIQTFGIKFYDFYDIFFEFYDTFYDIPKMNTLKLDRIHMNFVICINISIELCHTSLHIYGNRFAHRMTYPQDALTLTVFLHT